MYAQLKSYIDQLIQQRAEVAKDRIPALKGMQDYLRARWAAEEMAEIIFVCTHNSRRSHFGQIWAQALADYFQSPPLKAYSGGTKATAFHPHAIQAVEKIGFRVIRLNDSTNPLYRVRFSEQDHGITAFSKIYTHPANPQQNFCAVMTCSEAEAACPFIPGATQRLSLPYEDPKQFDQTNDREARYRLCCEQIARELCWVFQGLTT